MTTVKHELIKKHIDSFPVIPVSVARLMKVITDPESSAQDVMEAISPDQSLCLTVLKIANSVLFGRPQRVDSLRLAVTVLGFNEVQRIALSKALINSFGKLGKQHKLFIDKYWTHCFVCAMASKTIARDLQIDEDIAFMGGLLHDIGKLIMLEIFRDDYEVQLWMGKFSTPQALGDELHMFSFTHDQIGGQLLRKWNFPENLIEAVEFHHRPDEGGKNKGLMRIVQLADFLSFYCGNQKTLGGGGVLASMHTFLPHLQDHWRESDLKASDSEIVGWFTWLSNNYEQGKSLKKAFFI